jgi:glutathionylspermidine synthase
MSERAQIWSDPLSDRLLASWQAEPAPAHAAARELDRRLGEEQIRFGEGLLPTFLVPYLVERRRLAGWIGQTEALVDAVEQVSAEALRDRRLFDELQLRSDARDLVEIDPGYRRITVLSRPDAIVDGDRLQFIEFNCDSPAMMTFAEEVARIQRALEVLAPVAGHVELEHPTRALLDAILDCWREFGGQGSPTIAITDWEGQKTRFEQRKVAQRFNEAGVETFVCDPRAFRLVEGALHAEGRRVDLVYRRALFGEILDRRGEVEPLLSAYRNGSICMVNPLRSYLASSKTLIAFLWLRRPDLRPSLPRTFVLGPDEIGELRRAPARLVLKRGESHGGQHVLLPGIADEDAFAQALDEAATAPWIAQEYHPVPLLPVPHADGAALQVQHKFYNWNPFLFGGRYAGGIARASGTPLINISLGGGLLPTMPHG